MKREGPSSPLGETTPRREGQRIEKKKRATQKKKKEGAGTTHYAGVTFRSIYLVEGLKDSKVGMVARIYTKAASTTSSMEA